MTVAAWVEYVDPKHEAGKLIQRIMRGTFRATEAWTDGRHAEDDRYHARRNQLERFRVFLELMTRCEFEFRRRGNFFEGFEFLVCSKFNHTHTPCGCKCACAVACLHPHNSIPNVVVSVTIHDNI